MSRYAIIQRLRFFVYGLVVKRDGIGTCRLCGHSAADRIAHGPLCPVRKLEGRAWNR